MPNVFSYEFCQMIVGALVFWTGVDHLPEPAQTVVEAIALMVVGFAIVVSVAAF